jgi:hypothetical protein
MMIINMILFTPGKPQSHCFTVTVIIIEQKPNRLAGFLGCAEK